MNKYIVAHFSDYAGELLQEEVEATSKFEALKSYLEYPDDAPQTQEGIEAYCADTDQWVTAVEVGSFITKKNSGSGPWPFPLIKTH